MDLKLDKTAFNRWLDRQEGKYEWKDGRVVQMSNASKAHARIVANLVRAIGGKLDLDRWSVTASDLGVEDEDFLRFPDIIVEPMDDDDKGRRSRQPALLIEVLSPSSVGADFRDKPEEYMRFASLQAYGVVSQDAALCWIWQRDSATGQFPVKPTEFIGREPSISFSALGIDLPLAEIYRGIKTAD
ncbi:MAG: Uma2 family endonuclease [Hyphomicrobiaceae bacterium]